MGTVSGSGRFALTEHQHELKTRHLIHTLTPVTVIAGTSNTAINTQANTTTVGTCDQSEDIILRLN